MPSYYIHTLIVNKSNHTASTSEAEEDDTLDDTFENPPEETAEAGAPPSAVAFATRLAADFGTIQ